MEERRLIIKAGEIAEQAQPFSHPWNPNSELVGTRLGEQAGLSRIGVNWVRIPPPTTSATPPTKTSSSSSVGRATTWR